MGGGGRSCIVVGCKSRTTDDKSKHFYKFPKDYRKEIWITFSRRGQDYEPKDSSVVCQDHFDPSCYVYKKKQQCLAKDSIPTIFYRETQEGIEKIVLTFDNDVMHYVEEDTLLNPAFDKEKCERELVEKRQRKLNEIGRLCRFCFEIQEEGKCVAISRMKDYGISPNDMLTLVGINTEFNDIFSKSVCEECFQQIVSLDGYRKRCQKVQNQLIDDIKVLDANIQRLRNNTCFEPNSWFKPEDTWDESDNDCDNDEIVISDLAVMKKEDNFHQIIIKEEHEDDEMSDDNFNLSSIIHSDSESEQPIFLDDMENNEIDAIVSKKLKRTRKSTKADKTMKVLKLKKLKSKTVEPENEEESKTTITSKTQIIDPRPVNQRTYECFFCHNNFDGSSNFKTHVCPVKELVCEVQGCGRVFTALSGFNAHITKLHKLPKITRMYCAICRFSQVTNEEDFKEHSRQCEKTMGKKIDDSAITCETCGKFCPTAKSFSIHLMFHKITQPFQPQPKWKKAKRGVFICESCGKEFATPRYLKDHVKRLHT